MVHGFRQDWPASGRTALLPNSALRRSLAPRRPGSSVGQSGSFLNCRSQVRSLSGVPFSSRRRFGANAARTGFAMRTISDILRRMNPCMNDSLPLRYSVARIGLGFRLLILCGCAGLCFAGCESQSEAIAPAARPANIAGTWRGWYQNIYDKIEVRMILEQNGQAVSGTFTFAGGALPDQTWPISGTYDAQAGVLNLVRGNGTSVYRFPDDNTMVQESSTDPRDSISYVALARQ